MAVPLILPALGGYLAAITASLTGRVLLALGVSFVTYTGFNVLIGSVSSQVSGVFGQVPTLALQVMSVLQLDTCLNIAISAVSARTVVATASNGAITKMLFK